MSDDSAGASVDRVTEVSSTGWLSSIVGSFIGALVGFAMVVASCALLYWNEGRGVAAYTALEAGSHQVVEAGADPAGTAGLVHVTGPVAVQTPARDPVFGVGGNGAVRLRRGVEMYQWQEHQTQETHRNTGGSTTTETTYTYSQDWADHLIDSSRFHVANGHQNPPMPVPPATFDGGGPTIGAYKLDPGMVSQLTDWTAVAVPDGVAAPAGYQRVGDTLVRAHDPAAATVGDVRVAFSQIAPQVFSMVAAASSGVLTPYRGQNGVTIALAAPGSVSAAELFKEKEHEEGVMTWVLRGAGFVVMLIGLMLIARPLAVVVSVLPFLETIADAGVFLMALAVAVPLTLVVIAVAWFAHRPLLAGGLIAAAVVALVAFRLMAPGRRKTA